MSNNPGRWKEAEESKAKRDEGRLGQSLSDSLVARSNQESRRREELRVLSFPQKLHMLLRDAEAHNLRHVVSWNTKGTGFTIHNKYFFEAHIIPKFFNSSQYRAFQRSLNVWGFSVVSKGPHRGICWHPYFRRDREDLCEMIERVPIKSMAATSSEKQPSSKISFDDVESLELPPVRQITGVQADGDKLRQSSLETARELDLSTNTLRSSPGTTNELTNNPSQLPSSVLAQLPSARAPAFMHPDMLQHLQGLVSSQSLPGQAASLSPLQALHSSFSDQRQQLPITRQAAIPLEALHQQLASQLLPPHPSAEQLSQRLIPSSLSPRENINRSVNESGEKHTKDAAQHQNRQSTAPLPSLPLPDNSNRHLPTNSQPEQILPLLQLLRSLSSQEEHRAAALPTNLLQGLSTQQLAGASSLSNLRNETVIRSTHDQHQQRQNLLLSNLLAQNRPVATQASHRQPPQLDQQTLVPAILQLLSSGQADPQSVALLLQLLGLLPHQSPT